MSTPHEMTARPASSASFEQGAAQAPTTRASSAGDTLQPPQDHAGLLAQVDDYVRSNPVPALLGATAAGLGLALIVMGRPRHQPTLLEATAGSAQRAQRKAYRELAALLRESRRRSAGAYAEELCNNLAPLASQLMSAFATARGQMGDAVTAAAKRLDQNLR